MLEMALCFGCKPKVGARCQPNDGSIWDCLDERTALVCPPSGNAIAVPCKGKDGCSPPGQHGASCDFTDAAEGDACSAKNGATDARCLYYKNKIVECSGPPGAGKIHIRSCTGPRSCYEINPTVLGCDDG